MAQRQRQQQQHGGDDHSVAINGLKLDQQQEIKEEPTESNVPASAAAVDAAVKAKDEDISKNINRKSLDNDNETRIDQQHNHCQAMETPAKNDNNKDNSANSNDNTSDQTTNHLSLKRPFEYNNNTTQGPPKQQQQQPSIFSPLLPKRHKGEGSNNNNNGDSTTTTTPSTPVGLAPHGNTTQQQPPAPTTTTMNHPPFSPPYFPNYGQYSMLYTPYPPLVPLITAQQQHIQDSGASVGPYSLAIHSGQPPKIVRPSDNPQTPPPLPSQKQQTKMRAYCRRDKSLGVICENFISRYCNGAGDFDDLLEDDKGIVNNGARGGAAAAGRRPRPYRMAAMGGDSTAGTISIDAAATALLVERRRIYDIVNILESIEVVSRRFKKTYNWHGPARLPVVFAKLQRKAFEAWPEDAKMNNMTVMTSGGENGGEEGKGGKAAGSGIDAAATPYSQVMEQGRLRHEKNSLAKLTHKFIQLFLVGNEFVSLALASDKIIEVTTTTTAATTNDDNDSSNNNNNNKEKTTVDNKGIKTKVRRLYDIANVLTSIGVIAKATPVECGSNKNSLSFRWMFYVSVHDLQKYLTQDKNGQQGAVKSAASTSSL